MQKRRYGDQNARTKDEENALNSKNCLQTALDEVHLMLARPLGIGPDLTKPFPNVPVNELLAMKTEQ
jgi:hypothetical protein